MPDRLLACEMIHQLGNSTKTLEYTQVINIDSVYPVDIIPQIGNPGKPAKRGVLCGLALPQSVRLFRYSLQACDEEIAAVTSEDTSWILE
jgi:hypothetical protein